MTASAVISRAANTRSRNYFYMAAARVVSGQTGRRFQSRRPYHPQAHLPMLGGEGAAVPHERLTERVRSAQRLLPRRRHLAEAIASQLRWRIAIARRQEVLMPS